MTRHGHPLHLVDSSIFIFRAWFSLPADAWSAPDGTPLNALVGWARFLLGLLGAQGRGVRVAALFDESLTTSFRNRLYPAYKANRELPDAALKAQFGWCRELAEAAGVAAWAHPEFEADDLIATLQANWQGPVVIHTRDKDLGQLLRPGDLLRDPDGKDTGPTEFRARFGVDPERFPCWQALAGDSVDNVPGVRGVGPKSATALVRAFGDLDGVLAAAADGQPLPVRREAQVRRDLQEQAETARLCRQLVALRADVPGALPTPQLAWQGATAALPALLERLTLTRTLGAAVAGLARLSERDP